MRPDHVSIQLGLLIEPQDGILAVLEVALQSLVQAVHDAHPSLTRNEPPPCDPYTCLDRQLAAAVVSSARSLLDLLRCYRAARDVDLPF